MTKAAPTGDPHGVDARPLSRRVALVLTGTSFGGAEQIALSLAGGLVEHGWQPIIVHLAGSSLESLASRCDETGVPRVAIRSMRGLRGLAGLRSVLGELDVDLVDVHLGWPAAASLSVVLGAWARSRPLVLTEHLYIEPALRVRVAYRALRPFVRGYVAVSSSVAERLRRGLGIDRGRITVIENGIDTSTLTGRTPPESHDLAMDEAPSVVTVAQLRPQKDLRTLIEAAALLPDVHFRIIGEGSERPALEDAIRSAGLTDRVELLGFRSDVGPYLRSATLFALTSRFEGLPVAVLEAMAAGLPVVATDVDGTRDVVVDGETGFLVRPRDAVAVAAAIARLVAEPATRAAMGRAGATRAADFTAERMVGETAALFGRLVESGGRRPDAARPTSSPADPGLRDLDWRFLIGQIRFARVATIGRPAPSSLADVADAIVEARPGAGCDLVLVDGSSAAARAAAVDVLAPGGWCVAIGSRGRKETWPDALRPASTWVVWPESMPRVWLPMDNDGAMRWLAAHATGTGSGVFARARLRWLAWQLRARFGLGRTIEIAQRVSPGATLPIPQPIPWAARAEGSPGADASTAVLLTPGRHALNKVVGISLIGSRPVLVSKVARSIEAEEGLHQEAEALETAATHGLGERAGVPELLRRGQLDGRLVVIERALLGVPGAAWLRRAGSQAAFDAIVDWLIHLARTTSAEPPSSERDQFLDAVRGQAGSMLDAAAVSVLRDLPVVMEHRDLAPWNVVGRDGMAVGVLDWESATVHGWPGPDLVYFSTYAAVSLERATTIERRVAVARRLQDPSDSLGRVADAAWRRYASALGLPLDAIGPVRTLTWAIHMRSAERRRAMGDGAPDADMALFRALAGDPTHRDP